MHTVVKQIFPEGLKIKDLEGPGKLQPLLSKLNRYSFEGYVKVTVKDQLTGFITLKEGVPQNAILVTPSGKKILGLEALQKIQSLDQLPEIGIEVHTNIDIDGLVAEAPGKLPSIKHEFGEVYARIQEDEFKELIEEELEEELIKERVEGHDTKEDIEEGLRDSERVEKETKVYQMAIRGARGEPGLDESVFTDKFTFRNFIVGTQNKFAFAAAKEVARSPGGQFNPLLITSPSGLGKTHLLKAIGNYIGGKQPELNIEYMTTADFTAHLKESVEEGDLSGFRKKYFQLDVILMDDIQFIGERKDVQEELFHLFNHVVEEKGQIVISSDRHPDRIPCMDDRLISRFKSGLVVDIGRPEFGTRMAIVDKILRDNGTVLDVEIKECIAKKIKRNVREIEGGLTRILAFSSLLGQEITLNTVKEMLGEGKGGEGDDLSRMSPGNSYLVKDDRPESVYLRLKQFGEEEDRGINIISRVNPDKIKENITVKKGEVYWLTAKESSARKTVSPNLEGLTWRIEEMMKDRNLILLDGLEYLVSTSGFDPTIQFIRHIVDSISETSCIFILPVKPGAFEKKELSLLEREMKVIEL